jgi:histidinol-phosphate aminotransferase
MKEKKARPALDDLAPYIPGKSADEVKKEFGISSVIKLASNENPLGTPESVKESVAKEIHNLYIYPDQHATKLRDALAKKFDIPASHVFAGNGSDEIMELVAAAYLNAGEEVLVPEKSFSTYEFCGKVFDGKVIKVPLKNLRCDLSVTLEMVTPNTKLVYLGNPNNPTGTIIAHKELEVFLNRLPKGIIVVLDEAYGEFAEDQEYPNGIDFVKNGAGLVVLRTFSKFYGLAGIRVGYGFAKPEIIKYLDLVKLPFNVNRLAQVAALAALEDTEFEKETLKTNREGKVFLYKEFDRLKLEYLKTEANFIFVKTAKKADEVFLEMMKAGVIIRPLTSFGFPHAIRISIGTKEQNQKLVSALEAVLGQ